MKAKARVDRPHAIWTIPTTPKHRFHWGTNLKLATIPENSPMIWPRGALQSVETSIFHRTSSCGFPARYANRCHFSISDSIFSRVNPTNVNSNRYSLPVAFDVQTSVPLAFDRNAHDENFGRCRELRLNVAMSSLRTLLIELDNFQTIWSFLDKIGGAGERYLRQSISVDCFKQNHWTID